MGKFETYPEATTLENSDITLYNKSSITHKVTFGRLVNLIKSKIAESGLITSINTGAGLTGGEITSSGTIKCKLKSEVPSSLASVSVSTTADRQYPVNLDRDGNLSVNVPWAGDTYIGEKGVTVANNKISATLKNNTPSSLSSASMGSTADRQYAVGLDIDGKLSVNIPWTDTVGMTTNGSNADSHVNFAGAFTVGSRKSGSTVGTNSIAEGSGVTASGDYSHAEGFSATASAPEAHVEGCYTIASGICSHAEGWGTEASEEGSHAEGNGLNLDEYSHGSITELNTSASNAISANNYGSHAEGFAGEDRQSLVAGIIQANGIGSHAEGCADADGSSRDSMIIASGIGSHAEGWADNSSINCYILASGNGSHAEGIGTKAGANGSHAEGRNTETNGINSHAEGNGSVTTSSAEGAHAEGNGSWADGRASHAEGYGKAGGNFSHAEGYNTHSNGMASHAEGYDTYSTANYSHAGGYGARSPLISQFVHGGYNKKFGESSNNYRGVFGFQPDGQYYTTDTTITDAYNGAGGTADANVTLTLSLKPCAMYMLYITTYEEDDVCDANLYIISTRKNASNVATRVTDIIYNTADVVGKTDYGISINSDCDYMFHLIRIM